MADCRVRSKSVCASLHIHQIRHRQECLCYLVAALSFTAALNLGAQTTPASSDATSVAPAASGSNSTVACGCDSLVTLDPYVVTAAQTKQPLTIDIDPRAPAQPVPAHDGADVLKSIAGFSVVRKGGTDGDPVLRGMAGSRLGILVDGEAIYGGCGNRMDPPTAYVFPAAYDRVTIIKGPQTVLHGPGNSAGVVLFERDLKFEPRIGEATPPVTRHQKNCIPAGCQPRAFHMAGTPAGVRYYNDFDLAKPRSTTGYKLSC